MFNKDYRSILLHISWLVHGECPIVTAQSNQRKTRFPSSKKYRSREVQRFVEGITPKIRETSSRIHRAVHGLGKEPTERGMSQ